MSRLISSTATTADSVSDVADWFVGEGEHDQASRDQFRDVAGMLMGRPTYEGLADYWTKETGPWADLINPMPKWVATRTLSGSLGWNATALEGDAAESVTRLKVEVDRDLILIGCGELARHLAANGLIDEYRLWLHPALWGTGTRAFEGIEHGKLRLLEAKPFDSGVTLLRYEPRSD
jgi:dihydrofolate reductase